MKKRIFQGYFFSELANNFFAIIIILFLIVTGRQLIHFLERIADDYYPHNLLFPLLFFGSFEGLLLAIPLASTLAIVLVFGRLNQDNELNGFFNSGVGYGEIYASLFRFLIPLALLMTVLALEVLPRFRMEYEIIKLEAASQMNIANASAGAFHSPTPGLVFFAEKRDETNGTLLNIFIAEENEKDIVVETAKRGIILLNKERKGEFHLYDGERYEQSKSGEFTRTGSYETRTLIVPVHQAATREYSAGAMSMSKLINKNSPSAAAELQRRVSLPALTIILALLIVPLCVKRAKPYQYGNALPALLIFMAYEGAMLLVVKYVKEGILPVFPGVWTVHFLALLTALLATRAVIRRS